MNKLVICTVGTSIASQCPALKEMIGRHTNWDDDANLLRSQIQDFLSREANKIKNTEGRKLISAELNTLNRLGINRSDRVILLSSDNAPGWVCSEMNKKVIMDVFKLSSAYVTIHRIEGLQVHNAKILREKGLKNLIKVMVDEYLANEEIRYNYDIIINPTAGFKGVVPFLIVLGMLYGKRTVYMFEFSDELINIPPLPFSFDIELYERVRPALLFIDKEVAVPEEVFLNKIKNYSPEERDRFMAFTEPFDSNNITLSPLAYCLKRLENNQEKPMISQSAIEQLKEAEGPSAYALKRLIANSINPLWRNKHIENCHGTDLLVLKQISTAERIAGFLKGGKFYITHAYKNHEEYMRFFKKYKKKDFNNVSFSEWAETEEIGVLSDDKDDISAERDMLIIEKKKLEQEIKNNKQKIEELKLEILELSEQNNNIKPQKKNFWKTLLHRFFIKEN